MWNVIRMDTRHIAHHSNSASNACQQGKEKWSQKHPEVVNSNLLGQNQVFHPEKLWSTMIDNALMEASRYPKPQQHPTFRLTGDLVGEDNTRALWCNEFPLQRNNLWHALTTIKLIKLSFEMTGSLGPFENLHRSALPSKHPNPSSYQFSTSRTTAWDDSDMKPVDSTKIK